MAAYLMEKSDLVETSAPYDASREAFIVPGVTLEAVERFGRAISDGIMGFSEAHDLLVRAALNKDPDTDVDDLELKLGTALSDAAALAEGLPVATVTMRQDTHPSLVRLLGLDPSLTATQEQVAHLLNGTGADGSAIPDRHNRVSVGYIDLTWSAGKTLSLAWAFAPTERERSIIFNAHKEAVQSSMWYVAGVIGRARRGDGGSKGSDPGHISWMEFHHQTSRPTLQTKGVDDQGREYTVSTKVPIAGDPQLHTHVTVPNVVLTDDGRVGTLDLQRLHGRIKEFGTYYQAHLATNLRRHGIEASFKHTEVHVHGVPDHVRRHFSKRHNQAEERARELAKEQGLDLDAMPDRDKVRFLTNVVKSTRKKLTGARADFADWRRQAEAIGWQHRSVLRPGQEQAPPPEAERIREAYRASLPLLEEEFQRRAVITDEDARVIACRGLITSGITSRRDIDKVTETYRREGVTHRGQKTALVWAPDPRGRHKLAITTDLHEAEETELIGLVRAAAGDRSGSLRLKALNQAVQRSALDFSTPHGREQLRAMRTLATGGRFGVVIGVAGSGKSAMLRPLVDAWHASGKRTIGLALAWRQTEALADAGIIQRHALHGFLLVSNGGNIQNRSVPLDRNTVLVIDEVGQVGTHQLLQLARLQKETGCSIVALGDDRQCQSIEAGPVIDLLRKALGEKTIPELLMTIRQQTERERAISYLFRDGDASAAIAMKREDNTARLVAGSYQDTVDSIASLWRQRVEANAADPHYRLTVMAPTNADARAVSAAIRKQRQDMGLVGKDERVINAVDQMGEAYELPLAVGDNIRLFDRINATFAAGHGNIGNNGSVLQVREMTEDTITLRDRNGRDGVVKWETLRSGARIRLAHGDVLTIDAGQGITSTEHIDAMPSGSSAVNGFKAYVTESRHRRVSFMVVSDGAERAEIFRKRSIGDPTPISEEDVWRNVARNLSRQTTKESATAMLQRLSLVQRSAESGIRENAYRQSAWHYSRFIQGLSQAARLVVRSMRFSSQTQGQNTTLGP